MFRKERKHNAASGSCSDIRQNQTFLFNAENENRHNLIGKILEFETLSTEKNRKQKRIYYQNLKKEDKGRQKKAQYYKKDNKNKGIKK